MRHADLLSKTLLLFAVLTLAACDWRGDEALDVLVPRTVDDSLFTVTQTGLKYFDFEEGNGDIMTQTGDRVNVQYVLWTWPAKIFVENGQFPFTIGNREAIDGFDEGSRGMKLEGERQIIVPSNLAYSSGDLLFEIFVAAIDTTGR